MISITLARVPGMNSIIVTHGLELKKNTKITKRKTFY